jgi:hypothetical protein
MTATMIFGLTDFAAAFEIPADAATKQTMMTRLGNDLTTGISIPSHLRANISLKSSKKLSQKIRFNAYTAETPPR